MRAARLCEKIRGVCPCSAVGRKRYYVPPNTHRVRQHIAHIRHDGSEVFGLRKKSVAFYACSGRDKACPLFFRSVGIRGRTDRLESARADAADPDDEASFTSTIAAIAQLRGGSCRKPK